MKYLDLYGLSYIRASIFNVLYNGNQCKITLLYRGQDQGMNLRDVLVTQNREQYTLRINLIITTMIHEILTLTPIIIHYYIINHTHLQKQHTGLLQQEE